MEMWVKVGKLIWKNIGVWDDVELIFAEFLLHLHNVVTETILPSELIRLREMVDLLVFVQALVHE